MHLKLIVFQVKTGKIFFFFFFKFYLFLFKQKSLCDEDIENLKNWGFNFVRLGVM